MSRFPVRQLHHHIPFHSQIASGPWVPPKLRKRRHGDPRRAPHRFMRQNSMIHFNPVVSAILQSLARNCVDPGSTTRETTPIPVWTPLDTTSADSLLLTLRFSTPMPSSDSLDVLTRITHLTKSPKLEFTYEATTPLQLDLVMRQHATFRTDGAP